MPTCSPSSRAERPAPGLGDPSIRPGVARAVMQLAGRSQVGARTDDVDSGFRALRGGGRRHRPARAVHPAVLCLSGRRHRSGACLAGAGRPLDGVGAPMNEGKSEVLAPLQGRQGGARPIQRHARAGPGLRRRFRRRVLHRPSRPDLVRPSGGRGTACGAPEVRQASRGHRQQSRPRPTWRRRWAADRGRPRDVIFPGRPGIAQEHSDIARTKVDRHGKPYRFEGTNDG